MYPRQGLGLLITQGAVVREGALSRMSILFLHIRSCSTRAGLACRVLLQGWKSLGLGAVMALLLTSTLFVPPAWNEDRVSLNRP